MSYQADKNVAKCILTVGFQKFKKKNASAWRVGEFNFGSFELLKTKNGSVVVVGSGKVFFLPGQVSSACKKK